MNPDPNTCIHLTPEQILEIHSAAIRLFGGSPGLRDSALLQSAAAAPQATFGGNSTFADTVEVAAAYLYYLCSNHPFVDGNKRVALGSCLVFLELNGYQPAPDSEDWENLTLAVAAGLLSREDVTATLRKLLS
ncbi:type II toxin-antitoxin system death-on-curing family toxin [Luteolibacter arcticus]|uniref:Type II toxin-antitoxin system death-on-curing family toxin n=1 Tax=Luteolibacter arcticus TaxID=1581411 RepID=A0ABT3GN78_9BACT|nr:type II toxin-antitoxin system death-on-curing family toxin [Luteolibacter arcticus]MCW1924964.1 type II toxin-antitoxin system death-on-curing family toxin [Luteolibacter arcticus]